MEFTYDLHIALNENHPTDFLVLDIYKAFHRVSHTAYSLKYLSLKPTLTLPYRLKTYSVCSWCPPPNAISGVPQGPSFSAFLKICISDLAKEVSFKIRLFADDCVSYDKITRADDIINVQEDRAKVVHCCPLWIMQLDASQCRLVPLK